MCQSPMLLQSGQLVACRKCPQCVDLRINDWVGRNIAEHKTSVASHAITLTYGRNEANEVLHERAVILTYSDVQKYLKLLRRHRYPVRYFVTGEFGGLKGRAHWHIICHWQKRVPVHETGRRMHRRLHDDGSPAFDGNGAPSYWWPHGWSYWTKAHQQSVRYNCKYIQKDLDDAESQGHLGLSRNPPLGALYFKRMAQRYAQQGLAPQSLDYNFPDILFQRGKYAGQRRQFRLTGRSAELFLEEYIAEWRLLHGDKHPPMSELVEEFMDPGAWAERAPTSQPFIPPVQKKHVILRRGAQDLSDWEIAFYEQERQAGRPGVEFDPFEQQQRIAVTDEPEQRKRERRERRPEPNNRGK